jgi:hypothetical protein
MENLLPAAKNIGTTQSRTDVTGCTLWNGNVGEAAGALTAYCLMKAMSPRQVRNTPKHLRDFQRMLGYDFRRRRTGVISLGTSTLVDVCAGRP